MTLHGPVLGTRATRETPCLSGLHATRNRTIWLIKIWNDLPDRDKNLLGCRMSDMRGVGTRPVPRQTRGGRTRVCTVSKYTVLGSSTRSRDRGWLADYAYLENRGCNYSVITV